MSDDDNSLLGWTVTLLYLVAAWWSWRARAANRPFWSALALVLLLLGLNKQLDLQTHLIAVLRTWSRAGDWYAHRRAAEAAALWGGLLVLAAAAWAAWRWRLLRGAGAGLAATGMALLALAIASRAARILHVDALAAPTALIHRWLEPGGLLLVIAAAEHARRSTTFVRRPRFPRRRFRR